MIDQHGHSATRRPWWLLFLRLRRIVMIRYRFLPIIMIVVFSIQNVAHIFLTTTASSGAKLFYVPSVHNHREGGNSQTKTQQQQQQPEQSPLNIVLFYADDWTARTLGSLNPAVQTPVLDELARNGILFTHNCVTTSICWMSRATLYTGMYTSKHEMYYVNSTTMFNRTVPWTETLYPLLKQRAGYHTGFVGKWHHPQPPEFMKYTFDYTNLYHGTHWMIRAGKRRHVTDLNEHDAIHYLRNERPRNKKNSTTTAPFALTVSFFATHSQDYAPFPHEYEPMKTSMGWYINDTIPVPQTATQQHWDDMPWFFHNSTDNTTNEAHRRYNWRYNTNDRYQTTMKNYYRMATEVDAAIGNIIQELKDQGVYNNTLIIFTSDNGMFHSEHQLAGKWYPHEESIRVPLIIQDPRMPPNQMGSKKDDFTLSVDLAPTILSAAGIRSIPTHMQGRDMAQLYLDPGKASRQSWRKDFFYEFHKKTGKNTKNHNPTPMGPMGRNPSVFALIRKDYKYFYWPETSYEQLFHIAKDPREEYDVYNTTAKQNPRLLNEIKQRYSYLKNRSQSGGHI